jgi:ubiquinone/menaquinone biosynthesis C-methylase UbiE
VYDLVQFLVGVGYVKRRLRTRLAALGSPGVVVDLAGGTGMFRGLWASARPYVCVDIDPAKVRRFRRKFPSDTAVLSDALRAPFVSGTVDVVACVFVAHHLADPGLQQLLREGARILKPSGRLVFLDPLWVPTRPLARLLWRCDRGSYPRTAAGLREAIEAQYDILQWEEFAIVHQYALCVGARRAGSRGTK